MHGATVNQKETMGRTDDPTLFNAWDFTHNEDVTEFTVSAVAGGGAANLTGVPNGVLRLAGAATTAGSGANVQLESTPIRLDSQGAFASMECRFKLNDLKQEFFFGLSDVNANVLAGLTDALGVQKAAGAAGAWSFRHARSSNGRNVTDGFVAPLVADTKWHKLTIWIDNTQGSALGGGNVKVAIDGTVVKEFDLSTSIATDDNLSPVVANKSGDAVGTQTTDIDYINYTSTRSSS